MHDGRKGQDALNQDARGVTSAAHQALEADRVLREWRRRMVRAREGTEAERGSVSGAADGAGTRATRRH